MLTENIIKFIERANSELFTYADIRTDFQEMNFIDEEKYKIDISFGQFNNRSEIPWISILDKSNEQKTSNGIYPVYLYYKAINKLIFAYGISAEIPPNLNWNDDILINTEQIRDYFKKNSSYNNIYNRERRTYKDSYVYQIYDIVAESDNVQIFQNNNIVSNSKLEEDLIQILDSYDISLGVKNNYDDFTSKPEINEHEYEQNSIELEELDKTRETLTRKEQSYLRKKIFNYKTISECSICDKKINIEFLVCAHIKKRSKCNDEEKRNMHNVTPMCKFGCDELFERGYIVVENGKIKAIKKNNSTEFVNNYLYKINGKICNIYNDSNDQFFRWHKEFHNN